MKKLGSIFIALVVAFSLMGVGYATWTQTLTVNGTVNTGTFDVVFNSFTAPAGTIGSGVIVPVTPDGTDPTHKYIVSVSNLYPGKDEDITFVLKNTGTVPAKITAIKIGGTDYMVPVNRDLTPTDSKNDIKITVSGIDTTTTLGVSGTVTGHLVIHTWIAATDGTDATPGTSGSFTFTIETAQQY